MSVHAMFYVTYMSTQVTPYITEGFDITFEAIRPYMYYIGSGLALYFPYDACLYSSASALAIYTFRFVPLFLAVVITAMILLLRSVNFGVNSIMLALCTCAKSHVSH